MSQLDPYCTVPLNCLGYTCNLRVSVVANLFAAWLMTHATVRCWMRTHDHRPLHCSTAAASLCTWLQLSDASAFIEDLCVTLLSVRGPERQPHLTNTSVAFQLHKLAALGYASPALVLHWILSPELLPLVSDDIPVCGADCAWRFGCVPLCLLSAET